ncbi:pentatricopeptide repeat-containing protein [Trifolium pratense]|uniref:Pentatricopeptide repeat-containing protein n=1 Tax=Trifolium pratense TaxID=57577 RepID=A0A2K3PPQ5_TRIPR|nr:pentatricopeptide repeat-containing protein [Trifolium pratense]
MQGQLPGNMKTRNNRVVDVCRWNRNGGMLPFSTIWNSLINEFAQQGMCVEVFKYFRSIRLLVPICSRILMRLFIACIDPLLPNGKEMNRYGVRFFVDMNDWLATTLGEILIQFWNTWMGSLDEMKTEFPFGIMLLGAFRQWGPGELNFLWQLQLATIAGMAYLWVGIDRDLDEEVSLDFDPKPEVWTGEYTQGSMERE